MTPAITIMMYHYVRPIADSAWPGIKGMEVTAFEQQLDYIQVHYNVVSFAQIIAARREGVELPPRPLMLSFDDGFVDHFTHAFPALRARGMSGVFFPPTSVVCNRKMLDVHKIHFVLAAMSSAEPIVELIDNTIRDAVGLEGLESIETYKRLYAVANRFDPAPVIYIKRMLQQALPETIRGQLVDDLFRRSVSEDPSGFADELYISMDDLSRMNDAGMEIGSHGHDHLWMDHQSVQDQEDDVVQSLRLFDRLGLPRDSFTFCYPYGAYNSETLTMLESLGCVGAVTTKRELGGLNDSLLELPRLDAVDLPCVGDALPNPWTMRVM